MRLVAAVCVLAALPATVLAVTAHGDFPPVSASNLDRLPKPLRAHIQSEVAYLTAGGNPGRLRSIDVYGPASRAALVKASFGATVMVRAKTPRGFYLLILHDHLGWVTPTGGSWVPPPSTEIWSARLGPTGAVGRGFYRNVPWAIAHLPKIATITVF